MAIVGVQRVEGQFPPPPPPPDFGWNISPTFTYKKTLETTRFCTFGFVDLPTSLGQGHTPTLCMTTIFSFLRSEMSSLRKRSEAKEIQY